MKNITVENLEFSSWTYSFKGLSHDKSTAM